MEVLKTLNGGGKKSPSPLIGRERYDALDGLRVLACIGIVLMHVLANVRIKPSESFLTVHVISFTGDFVLLFMMISAFSLSCGYFGKFRDRAISMNDFYRKRYMRVLPFFALLVLTDVFQTFVSGGFAFSGAMEAELYEAYADLTLAFGLLPGAQIHVIGVGWFLGLIFLFYMLYPFYTFLLHTKRRAWMVLFISSGLYFAVHNYFVPVQGMAFGSSDMLYCAPYFIAGGMVYLYRKDIVSWGGGRRCMGVANRWWLLCLAAGYTVFFFMFPSYRVALVSNLLLYTSWLIYAVAESYRRGFLNNPVMAFFSGISMEIYLCHMMFFRLVEKLHIERYAADKDLQYWITSLIVIACSVCFSVCWKFVEKRIPVQKK